jgi:hypothetical protein
MHDVLTLLTSPVFWAGTVIAGLVVNLISAYAQRPLDRAIDRVLAGRRTRSELQRHKEEREIWLLTNYWELVQYEFQILVQDLFAGLIGLMGAGFSISLGVLIARLPQSTHAWNNIVPSVALFAAVVICLAFTLRCFNRAGVSSRVLTGAMENRRKKIFTEVRANALAALEAEQGGAAGQEG